MRRALQAAWALAPLLLPTVPVEAGAADPFEVEVLRGSTHSVVTRDPDGATREVTLREAPPPAIPEQPSQEPDAARKEPAQQTSIRITVITEPRERTLLPAVLGAPHHRRVWHHRPPGKLRAGRGLAMHPRYHRGHRHQPARFRWRMPSP